LFTADHLGGDALALVASPLAWKRRDVGYAAQTEFDNTAENYGPCVSKCWRDSSGPSLRRICIEVGVEALAYETRGDVVPF